MSLSDLFSERRLLSSPPGCALLDGPGHAAPRGPPAARGPPPRRVERPRTAAARSPQSTAAAAAETEAAAEPPHDQLPPGTKVRIVTIHTLLPH